MHRVSWEREVRIEERDGRKVVVKLSRPSRAFRMFLLALAYSSASVLFLMPTPPFPISEPFALRNEGFAARKLLRDSKVTTPELLELRPGRLVEQYVHGIEGRRFLESASLDACEAFGVEVGSLTARMHRHGYAFHDNKAQNYLVEVERLARVDLSLFSLGANQFAMLIDVATFLGSILDLEASRFSAAQRGFCRGYTATLGRGIPVVAFGLRNLVSLLLAPVYTRSLRNMFVPIMACVQAPMASSRV